MALRRAGARRQAGRHAGLASGPGSRRALRPRRAPRGPEHVRLPPPAPGTLPRAGRPRHPPRRRGPLPRVGGCPAVPELPRIGKGRPRGGRQARARVSLAPGRTGGRRARDAHVYPRDPRPSRRHHRLGHPAHPAASDRRPGRELRGRIGAARLPQGAPGRCAVRPRLARPLRGLPRDARRPLAGGDPDVGDPAEPALARSGDRDRRRRADHLPPRRAGGRGRREAAPGAHRDDAPPLGAGGRRPRALRRPDGGALARSRRREAGHARLLGRSGRPQPRGAPDSHGGRRTGRTAAGRDPGVGGHAAARPPRRVRLWPTHHPRDRPPGPRSPSGPRAARPPGRRSPPRP